MSPVNPSQYAQQRINTLAEMPKRSIDHIYLVRKIRTFAPSHLRTFKL